MQEFTTLDLVLRSSGGALLVPLKKAALILGLETQTIRNRLSEKTFDLVPVKIGRRNFFRANEIARLIDASSGIPAKPQRGRPRKSLALNLK